VSVKRQFYGFADLMGQRINGLMVGDLVSRSPTPRWAVTCEKCGSIGSASHAHIAHGGATCQSSTCGKIRRPEFETLKSFTEAEERKAAAKRKSVEDAEVSKAALAEAEALNKTLLREIKTVTRQNLVKGTTAARDTILDPDTANLQMSTAEATLYNKTQADIFRRENPAYFACDANFEAITDHLSLHHIQIVSAKTWGATFRLLDSLGLMLHAPIAEPPVAFQRVPVPVGAPAAPVVPMISKSETILGIDPVSGVVREYTKTEIDRLSSDQYRRAFRLDRASLSLPNRMEQR